MAVNIRGRSFLKLLDYTPAEIRYLLDLSKNFKDMKRAGVPHRWLEGKNIVLLFEKTSTRTRCSFEVAGMDLGMGVTYLEPGSSQMGKKESIADTARVLGRMYDGIEYRGFSQDLVQELSDYAGVPVWNGLTDQFHPTQMLADLLTIEEKLGRLKGVRFTYFGDARNNMGNSLMVACAKMGMHFTACAPKELFPEEWLVEKARSIARETGGSVTLTEDVTQGAIFMHCLPSFHDTRTTIGADIAKKFGITEMEVTDQVFESKQSVVFDEAENRMHTIKAVIYATLH